MLWLCGPPGVGKTAVGWELFTQLSQAEARAGYVDIDQLGICYPEPASDPGRHRMKATNLGEVVANFRAFGAPCVVVSGVLDADKGKPVDQLPHAALTVCRLRAGREELRRRFLGRSEPVEVVDEVLREADALDGTDFADLVVDTSGRSIAETVRLVRERANGWLGPTAAVTTSAPNRDAVTADGQILWLCGATGVGKSTAGFDIYQRTLRAGHTAAYVDLDQIGFCGSVPADSADIHRVRARNLAALWQTYRTAGAERLVVVGPVDSRAAVETYVDALPEATVTLCRLHADRDHLARRITRRQKGGSWPQPGDPLKGQPTERLRRIASEAAADALALDRIELGDVRVDTSDQTVGETADAIIAATGWPG